MTKTMNTLVEILQSAFIAVVALAGLTLYLVVANFVIAVVVVGMLWLFMGGL